MTGPVCESYLRFNLPAGSRHHEEVNPNDTGVDFEIASTPPVWLEVKNWDAPVIPVHKREHVDTDFADKTRATSTFWDAMVAKFEGTYDCLQERGELPTDARLGLLLESKMFSIFALAPALSVLEARVALSRKVGGRPVGIVNVAGVDSIARGVSAVPCAVTPYPKCVCADPVFHCSALRRTHSKPAL